MFTGIVEELGTVRDVSPIGDGPDATARLAIDATTVLDDATIGASIAVNGCCLTVVELGDGWWATDVSRETLARTVIGGLAPGDVVNLERPMALGDRLGGHLVLGHVDAVGEIVDAAPDLRVRIPIDLHRYLVEKGSVTVDGISLTAFDLVDDTFRVRGDPPHRGRHHARPQGRRCAGQHRDGRAGETRRAPARAASGAA